MKTPAESPRTALRLLAGIAAIAATSAASAQWVNHYPKLDDFGHHVYLEQHELPLLAHGPTDPAPSPDGQSIAIAAQGWIWRLDIETGVAERLTRGPHSDSRPRWSPDGQQLAFVRDTGTDTEIVVRTLSSGRETVINSPTIELDPEFSSDGQSVFYTSGQGNVLSLWRRHLASGVDEQITDLPQVERNVRRLADGRGILYLHGAGSMRTLRMRDFIAGEDIAVVENTLTYHLTADVHPTDRVIVFSDAIDDDYQITTIDLDQPGIRSRVTTGSHYALTPAWSADGQSIFYVEPDANQQFRLMQVPTFGGTPQRVDITRWDYGVATGTLTVTTRGPDGEILPARLSITDADGHPVASPVGPTYVDPQTGRSYFYTAGEISLTLPEGRYSVLAAHGPMSQTASETVRVVRAGSSATLTLTPLWDDAGYTSVDYHVHLNGDGQHRAAHADMLRLIAGEDLDQISPMSWNRWERRLDAGLVGVQTHLDGHTVDQAQEVRSHFHGHVGLVGVNTAYFPWFFGPSNPRFGDVDQSNASVLAYADAQGAFATYVHPISGDSDPFANFADNPIPLELVSDGVLANRMGLEIVCAWTSPLGTSALWYRFLNIGQPIAAMSGTDGWADFHRTPAMGTARAYVETPASGDGFDEVLAQAIAGRSFVTTGPALEFVVGDGARPGDTIASGSQSWQLTLTSSTDVDRVEIIVNGSVVETQDGVNAGETRTLTGTVDLPGGGWVAARAYASERQDDAWPSMATRPFAHASPIWIDHVGSVDPAARAAAASDLLQAIDVAQARAERAYGDTAMPTLMARFAAARARLQEIGAASAP